MKRASKEASVQTRYGMIASNLDERCRRLWAAAEATAAGYGGVSLVARATGLSRPLIHRGLSDLASGVSPGPGRVRRNGAGPPRLEIHQPGLKAALDAMAEPTSRGDPESPLDLGKPLLGRNDLTAEIVNPLADASFIVRVYGAGKTIASDPVTVPSGERVPVRLAYTIAEPGGRNLDTLIASRPPLGMASGETTSSWLVSRCGTGNWRLNWQSGHRCSTYRVSADVETKEYAGRNARNCSLLP